MESSFSSLSLADAHEGSSRTPPGFRFFDLPVELRMTVYELVLLVNQIVDLKPSNFRCIAPRLGLFLTCHRMHEEAYPVFYGRNTIRLFPIDQRFFSTKKVLLTRLSPRYRSVITTLDLRLGQGWGSPPKCQAVTERLGLADMSNLRLLKIFVECDPSDPIFNGFRIDQDFYTTFARRLVKELVKNLPSLQEVQFDGWPSVKKDAPLMAGLLHEVKAADRRISWGPHRMWGQA